MFQLFCHMLFLLVLDSETVKVVEQNMVKTVCCVVFFFYWWKVLVVYACFDIRQGMVFTVKGLKLRCESENVDIVFQNILWMDLYLTFDGWMITYKW